MADLLLSAWTIFYTLFLALVLFGFTVFVHEFGHFFVALRCGLVVQTFSIGFGKAIWKWERNGISYKIGWIPFGGYVALPQLDPEGMDRIQGSEEGEGFPEVSPWKKIAVAVAGPIGNIIFAFLLAMVIWLVPNDEAGTQASPRVGALETNSAAYASGLRTGDEILSVNGTAIHSWYDFTVEALLKNSDVVALEVRADDLERHLDIPVVELETGEWVIEGMDPGIPCLFGEILPESPAELAGVQQGDVARSYDGQPILSWGQFTEFVQATKSNAVVSLVVEREGESFDLSVAPQYNAEYDIMMIGVRPGGMGGMPWMVYRNPIDQLKSDAMMIVRVFKALTTREEAKQAAKSLGGPVAIFGMLMFSIKTGVLNTFGLIRLLNVNLAILNLLPIPVLDGGHILFALWHGVTRRKVNAKVQATLINVCAILLISAMLLITFNDIDRKLHIKEFFGKLLPGQTEQVEPVEGD